MTELKNQSLNPVSESQVSLVDSVQRYKLMNSIESTILVSNEIQPTSIVKIFRHP